MLSSYIRGLISAALIVTLALLVTPKGRIKKAVSFVCAVVMLTAALLPIGGIDFHSYSETISGYREDAEKYSDTGRENSKNLNRLYIQEKCEAYILDKAAMTGAKLDSVSVDAEWSEKGWFYPVSVEISGEYDENDKSRISAYIEAELGIESSAQKWRTNDEV